VIFGAEGVLLLIVIAFWIWAILDVIATEAELCRNLPKGVWLLLVVVLGDLGALAWLVLGRPEKGSWRLRSTDYSASRRPIAYEDEPSYTERPEVSARRSRELDRRLDEWEAAQREKRADSDRRGPETDS